MPEVNIVLMDLVVRLAATLDEVARLDDRYEREFQQMLEHVAGELEKLNPADRHVFVTHLEAMSASAASDPLASIDFRTFLAEFADGFGITEEPD